MFNRLIKGLVTTPTVLQMEAIECGAAALSIVAKHFCYHQPLEHWRTACGVSRDGVKAKEILQAARDHGFEAKGFKASAAELEGLSWPLILFWQFNHFLVLEGLDEQTAWLNDPATGPRQMPREEFERAYTGVALEIKPGDGFKPFGQPPGLIGQIKQRLTGMKKPLLLVVLTGLMLALPNLLIPAFNRVIADYFVAQSHPNWYWPLIVSMLVVALVQGVLGWLKSHQLSRLNAKLAITGAAGLFWHILHLPVGYFSHRNAAEVGSRVALANKVAGVATGRLAAAAIGFLTMVVYFIAMADYNLQLTLLALGFATLNLLLLKLLQDAQINGNRRLRVEQARYFSYGSKGLQTVEDIIASGGSKRFCERVMALHTEVVNQQQRLGTPQSLLQSLPKLLSTLGLIALVYFGGLDVMDGVITVGMLVAFQMLMKLFSAPVNQLVGLGQDMQSVVGDIERLQDVEAHERDASLDLSQVPANEQLKGEVELNEVTFAYSPMSPKVLQNFSMHIKPGENIALVGASGCGKSTLAKLLAKLYEPTDGSIHYDGIALSELDEALFRASIAYVSQEIRLFEGSITDNLTMSEQPPGQEVLVKAAKLAGIFDVIQQRPGGFNGKVASDGKNFSGGERQRLELARALVRSPSLLILDEATSALDGQTERAVIDGLTKTEATVIFVSHRLSALAAFDRILVLEQGQIVDSGSFDELTARQGPFKTLLEQNDDR